MLGSAAPHVLDMAGAYATFAAEGTRARPFTVSSVTRIEDKGVVYAYTPRAEQVFEPGVIADATYAMQQVIRRGSGSYAQGLGRPAAGKTGTSSDNKSAWFMGFTPQLSTAVALYNISGTGQSTVKGWGRYAGSEITGGSFPVRVWTEYMKAALDGVEVQQLPEPVYGGDVFNPPPPPPGAAPDPERGTEPGADRYRPSVAGTADRSIASPGAAAQPAAAAPAPRRPATGPRHQRQWERRDRGR